eukprot:CAMPEP_0185852310 /NCGR_PEP_ID=MMETSP1354-20130828/14180_1 /TAXON_ID=708628 /ORGANISM="Erythrolobus madagascarensis, Strain CCMP3276" /LENGTH=52 /DNA_ID=CAMNT_0028553519 /DNA_START=94 /DNA_END=249 /DNA_ORIENTATION=+
MRISINSLICLGAGVAALVSYAAAVPTSTEGREGDASRVNGGANSRNRDRFL